MKHFYFTLLAVVSFTITNAQIVNIPDANFKAKLLEASASNSIASTETPVIVTNSLFSNSCTVTSYNSIDINGDGEIQVNEAHDVKWLRISNSEISNLTGIEAFINLQFLNCYNNQLTSLDFSNITNLQYLICFDNQLTNLDVSNNPNLLTLYCDGNQLTNLDVSNLSNLKYLACDFNQLTSLNVSMCTNMRFLDCHVNLLSSLNISGLTNLQFLDCSYNQLSTIDVSGFINLEYLFCSSNPILSLEVETLSNLFYLGCQFTPLTSLDVSNNTNLQGLSCGDNQFLRTLYVKNNNERWNSDVMIVNSPNLTYICADEEDLEFFQRQINYCELNSTCQVNSYCSFTPGGVYYTIQGNSKLDTNTNGCDANDINFPNLKFDITNGSQADTFISNSSGNYSIPVQSGTHTFTPQLENPSYFTISPTTASVTFPATTIPFTQDFCITPNGVHHDLEVVVIHVTFARPGFDAVYKIKYKNKGNQLTNASLSFNYNDAVLDYVSTSIVPASQSSGVVNWNLGNLNPFDQGEILVTLNLNSPMETPPLNAGDFLNFSASISSPNNDETPNDNLATLTQTVVNSFDPNDKRCLEGNTISPTKIGEYIHYMIRFENTGTFPAENIVVKDMIDTTKFDVSTLQMTDASHTCYTRIKDNKVEFIFENINLPFDDATNDGYVVFKIKTLSTLTTGSQISNNANIYFDYNFPITTNTATSTFQTLANTDFDFNTNFALSPVPAKDVLTITSKQNIEIYSIHIYNTLGQIMQTITQPTSSIDVSGLKTGNYFLKVITDKGISSEKFLKE